MSPAEALGEHTPLIGAVCAVLFVIAICRAADWFERALR